MRKTALVLFVYALSSIYAANAATRLNDPAPINHAVYSTVQQLAGGKGKVCTTTWVTTWVTRWVATAKGKIQQKFEVRTPTETCHAVRG